MLRNSYGSWEETLVHKTEGYLHDAFGMSCKLEPYRPQSLPYFVGDQYRLWCSDLFGRPCLFMAPTPDAAPSVDEMVRHV